MAVLAEKQPKSGATHATVIGRKLCRTKLLLCDTLLAVLAGKYEQLLWVVSTHSAQWFQYIKVCQTPVHNRSSIAYSILNRQMPDEL